VGNKNNMTAEELLAAYDEGERDFSGADLRGAKLNFANLSHADLRGANLSEANLSVTDFSYAVITGANLSDAEINGAIFLTVINERNE
jgi:uncharacterized protein YjbI with pentapeptide repeats